MGPKEALKPPRAVLDTNVAVSALLFDHGSLRWLREAWTRGAFVPLTSRDTVLEIVRVLGYPKFKLSEEECTTLLGDYLPYCETVEVRKKPGRLPRCRDPRDLMFLELAVAGKADYVVTGDRDLLSISSFRVPIVSSAAFRTHLEIEP